MKKSLIILGGAMLMSFAALAQTTTPTPAESPEKKQADFDKKFRFGLKIAPQPTWLKSNNDNSKGSGVNFGFGFGLMFDIKLSDIIRFSTGIGGDFEGGYVTYKYVNDANDPTKNFSANMVVDKEGNMVEAKDGKVSTDYELVNGNTQFILNDRKYKTTFVTVPVLLKMMTQEYSGLRYFFNFGGEIGVRAGIKADDTYSKGLKTVVTGTAVSTSTVSELSAKGVDVSGDASLIPMRVGMNLGFGTEYRLGGSTALCVSVNYFQSFTNLMRKESKYITKGADNTYNGSSGWDFTPFNQGYFARAIRINIGLMF